MDLEANQVQQLVQLFKSGSRLTYRKGDYIIRPGETPDYVYYIETGFIKAFNISKYGEENLLIVRKESEIFPLIWALTGQERHIIYESITPSVVWRIDRRAFTRFCRDHPEVMLPVLNMVTEMYRIHSERIINLTYRTVRERLASFLITMASRFGRDTPDGVLIEVPLRHHDIASSINSARETTSRQIVYLEEKGLISTSGHLTIIIKDLDALKSIYE